jgi:hypothetical protein
MDNVTYRRIQRAWQKFDATTAYGCQNKKMDFDLGRCQAAWNEYNQTLVSLGVAPVSTPPMGLTVHV